MDDPHAELARNVRGGEHGFDAGRGERGRGLDLEHVGPGVVGEPESSVEHAGNPDVVDVVAVAKRELDTLVPDAAGPDAPGRHGDRHLAACQKFHRVEDLAVTGATAQMRPEIAGGLVAGEPRALPVDERFHPHEDARRAETTLQGATGGKGGREALPLARVEPLQSRDRPSGHLLERDLAAHRRLAVYEHRAASALARGRAAVFGRGYGELLAQGGKKMRVVPHLD